MKDTETDTRNIDSTGRLVIPKELRKKSGLDIGARFTMSIQGDALVLKTLHKSCVFCKTTKNLLEQDDTAICQNCLAVLLEKHLSKN